MLTCSIRADRVMRTSVVSPTTNGYQPVQAAQEVADRFTRIYGPVIWAWKHKNANGSAGLGCPQPVRATNIAPTVPYRPVQIAPNATKISPSKVAVVQANPAPRFLRPAQAAFPMLQQTGNLPPEVWDPAYTAGMRIIPRDANAAAVLATALTRAPSAVARPAVATALDYHRNSGKFY